MTRTKALVVVGCIMLALAAMAVMELKQETASVPAGQTITGSMAKTDAPKLSAEVPTAPLGGAVPPSALPAATPNTPPAMPGQPQKTGELLSLEPGTLHPENADPQTPSATPPADTPSGTVSGTQSGNTPFVPVVPVIPAQPAKTAPVKPEPAKAEPVKTETAQAAPVKPETAKTAPVKPESAKAEPAKTEPAKAPADQDAPRSESPKKDAVKAIDTAGPVKVDAGQKAIVWTRMELSDKGVVFRMSGAEKLEAKAFTLPNPDRYVVDLQGSWAMRLPTVPANSFLRKLRVGKQESNTRLVMDLSGARTCQMVRINPTTLEFRIK